MSNKRSKQIWSQQKEQRTKATAVRKEQRKEASEKRRIRYRRLSPNNPTGTEDEHEDTTCTFACTVS